MSPGCGAGLVLLIWMSGWLFIVRAASLAEWRHQRNVGPCGAGEHNNGSWVARAAGEKEAAPCCQYSTPDGVAPACGPSDGDSRDFKNWGARSPYGERPVMHGQSDFLLQLGGNGCKCKNWVDEYAWEPAKCTLAQWDAAAFCSLLGKRSLMFIGDSTMIQVGVAVINAVHWEMRGGSGGGGGGGCQEQLSVGLSSTLIGRALGVSNFGRRWVELANMSHSKAPGASTRPDIVVTSAGPHVTLLKDFELLLAQVVDEHRELFPEVKLVWQTQPGAGCAPSPLEEAPGKAFWARQHPKPQTRYNWPLFPAFDDAARARFAHPAASRENLFLLDVSPLALRADAHPGSRGDVPGDCVHSCLPGPLDHLVPRTLLHLMLHHGL